MSKHVFVTSEGRDIEIKPIAIRALEEIRATARRQAIKAGEAIAPPQYTATTVTGAVETYPHDATTLQTDEDKAAWAEHQAALARLEETIQSRSGRYVVRKGLIGCDPPQGWAAEQAAFGIEVNSDPAEMYYQYIDFEVLRTPADIEAAISAIMRLSLEGASPERLALLDDLFQRALEGQAPLGDTTPSGGMDV